MRQTPALLPPASSVQPRHSPISDIRWWRRQETGETGAGTNCEIGVRGERGDTRRSDDIREAAQGRAMPNGAARVTTGEAAPDVLR